MDRTAYICKNAIELKAALLAYKPWERSAPNLTSRFALLHQEEFGTGPEERFLFFAEMLKEYVFWHEVGHLHLEPRENELRDSLIGETHYYRYHNWAYSESLADAYAFEQYVDLADVRVRNGLLIYLLPEDGNLGKLETDALVVIRALKEPCPSLYVYDLAGQAVELLIAANTELLRRTQGLKREFGTYRAFSDLEEELVQPFLKWEQETAQLLRQEVAAWLA